MEKLKPILTQKPTLVATLIANGIECEETKSPFLPDRLAWFFEPTPAALDVVIEYYDRTGETMSNSITKAIMMYKGGELDEVR